MSVQGRTTKTAKSPSGYLFAVFAVPLQHTRAHGRGVFACLRGHRVVDVDTKGEVTAIRRAVMAERDDPRPMLPAPAPDAPWLPEMAAFNEVLGKSKDRIPPARNINGDAARVRCGAQAADKQDVAGPQQPGEMAHDGLGGQAPIEDEVWQCARGDFEREGVGMRQAVVGVALGGGAGLRVWPATEAEIAEMLPDTLGA
jgi:hypothetical protein